MAHASQVLVQSPMVNEITPAAPDHYWLQPSSFGQVDMNKLVLGQHKHNSDTQPNYMSRLFYHPFIVGRVRTSRRRYTILYDTVGMRFFTRISPAGFVRELTVGIELEELELFELFKKVTKERHRKAIAELPIAETSHRTEQWSRLIEVGLIGVGKKGYFVHPDFVSLPKLRTKLMLNDLPERGFSGTIPSDRPQDEIEANLRRCLWKLWSATLYEFQFVGLPYCLIPDSPAGPLIVPVYNG